MIGTLTGKPLLISSDVLILDVNGVGYRVTVPTRILSNVGSKERILLWIHTHVREDVLDLFGFETLDELNLFKLLISVSGIGPKTAVLVLNKTIDEIKKAIIAGDTLFFTQIPRLGKKNAQKLIIELRSKIGVLEDISIIDDASNDAAEALVSMGFSKGEIYIAFQKLPPEIVEVDEKIRAMLKVLGHR